MRQSYNDTINRMRRGFTLIEILIVVSLIGIMSITITQVFLSVLQSQSKGEIIKGVKQNGDYAYSVMESMIRNSQDITDPSSYPATVETIEIKNPDNFKTLFSCIDDGPIKRVASSSGTTNFFLTSSDVTASDCTFTVANPPNGLKYVFMSFRLSQANPAAGVAETATETFEGTVSLRNYE